MNDISNLASNTTTQHNDTDCNTTTLDHISSLGDITHLNNNNTAAEHDALCSDSIILNDDHNFINGVGKVDSLSHSIVTDKDNNCITNSNDCNNNNNADIKVNDVPCSDTLIENDDEERHGFMDVLGNGCLLKKTINPGAGRESRPVQNDMVKISYEVFLSVDNNNDNCDINTDAVESVPELVFILGHGDVIQALDLVVALAELHEEFEVITDAKYAYGAKGHASCNIPAHARLRLRVKLLEIFGSPDFGVMSARDVCAEGDKKREKGNYHYAREDYGLAVSSYSKALEILNRYEGIHDNIEESTRSAQAVLDMKLKVYNNIAAAQLKVGALEAACTSCDQVLKYQPDNVKALFRKGKAMSNLGEFTEALRLLRRAINLEPDSKVCQQEIALLQSRMKDERDSCRRVYSKMFPGLQNDSNETNKKNKHKATWNKWIYGAMVSAALSIGIAAAIYAYTRLANSDGATPVKLIA